jgi:hypothetical protein
MEHLQSFDVRLGQYEVTIEPIRLLITVGALAVATLALLWLFAFSEAAVDYTVEVPVQCRPGWEGETLEKPSIKVNKSKVI